MHYANKVCNNVDAGCVQIEYNCDEEKSSVKRSLVSSYNRVLAPKVKASVQASLSAAAAARPAVTIGTLSDQIKPLMSQNLAALINLPDDLNPNPNPTRTSR